MLIDFSQTEPATRYKLMSQVIVPRPIAWIVTEDRSLNIAPFSFFNGITSNPPTLMVAVGHKKDGSPKDTLANIRKTKKCVICSVVPESLEKMHYSSAELDADTDESEQYEIATKKVFDDFPPMIESAPTAFFCTLSQEITLDGSKTVPLFLTIEHLYVNDTIIDERQRVDVSLLGRVGHSYMMPGENVPAPVIPE